MFYLLSKEELDAEAVLCICPRRLNHDWFTLLGVYIILKLGQNHRFLKALLFISPTAESLLLLEYFWPAGVVTRSCLYRGVPVPCCHRQGSDPRGVKLCAVPSSFNHTFHAAKSLHKPSAGSGVSCHGTASWHSRVVTSGDQNQLWFGGDTLASLP